MRKLLEYFLNKKDGKVKLSALIVAVSMLQNAKTIYLWLIAAKVAVNISVFALALC
jgi:hypothetical protein